MSLPAYMEALVPAETAGKYLAPGDTLTVSGVFSSGVYFHNLRGGIVLLHDREYGLVPFGLGVSDVRGLIAACGFGAGEEAVVSAGAMVFPGLTLSLRPVPRQEPAFRPDGRALAAALSRGRRLLLESGKGSLSELLTSRVRDEVQNPFARAAFGGVRALASALTGDDGAAMAEALPELLGLGTGLTPSMDDFISAVCAALLRARDVWGLKVGEAGTLAEAAAALAPDRTTAVSAAYLLSSCRGETFSLLADVLCPLPELLSEQTVRALLRVGAGSGADMLTGTLFALEYLLEHYVPIRQ